MRKRLRSAYNKWTFLKQIFHSGQPGHNTYTKLLFKSFGPYLLYFYNILTYAACMAVNCILSKSHMVRRMLQSHSSKHAGPAAYVYYSNGACTNMSKTWCVQWQNTLEISSRCIRHQVNLKSQNPAFQVCCTTQLPTAWCWIENKTQLIVSFVWATFAS